MELKDGYNLRSMFRMQIFRILSECWIQSMGQTWHSQALESIDDLMSGFNMSGRRSSQVAIIRSRILRIETTTRETGVLDLTNMIKASGYIVEDYLKIGFLPAPAA